MTIARDRSNLPPATREGTRPPDTEPWFLETLVGAWSAARDAAEANETHDRPVDAPYFASDAGSPCLRDLYYRMSGVEGDGFSLPTRWKLDLGRMVHAQLESFPLPELWVPEVRFNLTPFGIPGRGRADVVIFEEGENPADHIEVTNSLVLDGDIARQEQRRTWKGTGRVYAVVDYMTQNGYSYKKAAVDFQGGPNGPSFGKEVQVAVTVALMGARYGVVANLAMEVLGPDFGVRTIGPDDLIRFAAQWTLTSDECAALAEAERVRVAKALAARKAGVLPPREIRDRSIPLGAVVTDPESGAWTISHGGRVQQAGKTFWCSYCSRKTKCLTDGDGTSDGYTGSEEF